MQYPPASIKMLSSWVMPVAPAEARKSSRAIFTGKGQWYSACAGQPNVVAQN